MEPARAFFAVPFAVVGVYLTNKCNFICGHCCTESTPSSENILKLSATEKYLQSILADLCIEIFHVSGGEPFMHFNALKKVVQSAREHGKRVAINTNGSFLNKKNVKDFIRNNRNTLTDIHLSFSEWHSEFMPYNQLREAADFCLSEVPFTELMIVTNGGSYEEIVNRIFPEGVPSSLSISHSHVDYIGRAHGLEKVSTDVKNYEPCSLVNRPTVLENGEVLLCCNTVNYANGASGLSVGNLEGCEFSEIIERARKNLFVKALRYFGPEFLLEYVVKDKNIRRNDIKETNIDKCTYCQVLTKNHETVMSVNNVLHQQKYKTALSMFS